PAAFGGGPTSATVSGRPMVVDYVAVWQTGAGNPPPPAPPPPAPPPPAPPPPAPPPPPSNVDFTQSAAQLNGTQARISFTPTTRRGRPGPSRPSTRSPSTGGCCTPPCRPVRIGRPRSTPRDRRTRRHRAR